MGRDKALLRLNGRPLALRAAEQLVGLASEVTLLGPLDRYRDMGMPVLPDEYPFRGPLAGLCTALRRSKYDWNLFVACDMPYAEREVFEILIRRALAGRAEAVVPLVNEHWQPLCAAYHRSCLPKMEAALRYGSAAVCSVFSELNVEPMEGLAFGDARFCDRLFRSVNSAEDWQKVRREVGQNDEISG
jgi:molybdopterin-guanine dinucleotide biosynthesis protein A